MTNLTRKSNITPRIAINPKTEALALEYLRANRGRPIYEPKPNVSKVAANIIGEPKNKNAANLHILKLRWREIVGEQMASLCIPEAIRGKNLVLRANGAAVPLLHMREKEILGLAALGCGVHFSKLNFVNAPLINKNKQKPKPQPIDIAQSMELERKLERVQSEGLKKALRLFNISVQSKLK